MATLPACFSALPPPPTKGYGEPYAATNKPIYVKDGRSDWQIDEGPSGAGKRITSEQALEATKDVEYETRRQDAKKYNEQLHAEGESHRTLGKIMMIAGVGVAAVGFGVMAAVPSQLREETTTPATRVDPDERITKPGGASAGVLVGGFLVGLVGVGMIVYGVIGGNKNPPYMAWKTPKPLDNSSYVRERTEPYNESIGAPAVDQQMGSVESLGAIAPGQRKPPAERPTLKPNPSAPAAAAPPVGSATPAPASSGKGLAPAPSSSGGKTFDPPASAAPPPSASSNRPITPDTPPNGRLPGGGR